MQTTAAATLAAWIPTTGGDDDLHAAYVAFAADPGAAHRETSVTEHLTASSFVFDESLEHVLLCFHGKGRFWVQFGGHVEADDASLFDAALREATEESGVAGLVPLRREPVDLNRHALSSRFGACRVHWDVGFAFTAPADARPKTSHESADVAWWPVRAVPDSAVAGLSARLERVLATLTA